MLMLMNVQVLHARDDTAPGEITMDQQCSGGESIFPYLKPS